MGPFPTQKAAEEELAATIARLSGGAQVQDRALRVGAYLDAYAAGKLDVKPSTLTAIREAIRLYWGPALGHLRLVNLRDHHISEAIREMIRINHSYRTASDRPRCCGGCLTHAPTMSAASCRPARSAARSPPSRYHRRVSPQAVFAVLRAAMNVAVPAKIATNPCNTVVLPGPARSGLCHGLPARGGVPDRAGQTRVGCLGGPGSHRSRALPRRLVRYVLLERMGLTVDPTTMQVKNTAAVMVTATLPPFSQPGSRIDVTIAAMGDAPSLQGGISADDRPEGPPMARSTPWRREPSVLGGFAAGQGANTTAVNHPTVSRIPDGAIVERGAPSVNLGSQIHLQLGHADFTTASRVAEALNKHFGDVAHADNAALISVCAAGGICHTDPPNSWPNWKPSPSSPTREAVIVVNERTGTIVMGKNVKIAPVAIMQGNLSVEIQTTYDVSQPTAALRRHHHGDAADQCGRQTGTGAQPDAERGRHGGRTGARSERHRLHAARDHLDSAESEERRERWTRS